jgi:2'-5' RNA ligase
MANNYFLAFDVAPHVSDFATRLIDAGRPISPESSWTSTHNLHVTFAFLGPTPPSEDVLKVLEQKTSALGFTEARVTESGYFGNKVWLLRVEVDEKLRELRSDLSRYLPKRLPLHWNPHLTLAKDGVERLRESMVPLDFTASPFRVESLKLFQTVGGGQPYRLERVFYLFPTSS